MGSPSLAAELMMKAALLLLTACVGALGAPDTRFSCAECVDEMHKLGWLIKLGAEDIQSYLLANYCPTVEEQEFCQEHLAQYYVGMLFSIVNHYFVDGAVHVCQTMGVCDARRYTCEECVEGLEWVKAFMLDPIMVAEYTIYLEQNFCLSDWENCKEGVKEYFPAMHNMAMEKFLIPVEICNNEPVCGADPPTKPPMF
eukprot:TRINITY_DN1321_c0_g1_i1.p1 TRINITY_DN1321_c0_g1~~TRINITY_DN1321_c0_g1_i1.p1  ORF type:complete len:214 (-),score=92.24 TRINITY_DN1321_c0_g1_i1:77-670(-)